MFASVHLREMSYPALDKIVDKNKGKKKSLHC